MNPPPWAAPAAPMHDQGAAVFWSMLALLGGVLGKLGHDAASFVWPKARGALLALLARLAAMLIRPAPATPIMSFVAAPAPPAVPTSEEAVMSIFSKYILDPLEVLVAGTVAANPAAGPQVTALLATTKSAVAADMTVVDPALDVAGAVIESEIDKLLASLGPVGVIGEAVANPTLNLVGSVLHKLIDSKLGLTAAA